MPEQVIDTNLYRWAGMHSIWGQCGVGNEGACYADLLYSPKKYIKIIGKDAPPIQVWQLIYNKLPPKLSNWWIAFLRQHIIPDEMLKQFTITRVKTKAHWPETWGQRRYRQEILDDIYYDEDNGDSDITGRYAGCVPWIQLDFKQTLSPRAIFAISNFFRYASEHGATIAATKALIDMEIPNMSVDQALILGQFLGGAKGHSVGAFGYLVSREVKAKTEDFKWKDGMAIMLEDSPFYITPKRNKEIDSLFKIDWSTYMDVGFNPGDGELRYKDKVIHCRVPTAEINTVFSHWFTPVRKRKVVKRAS